MFFFFQKIQERERDRDRDREREREITMKQSTYNITGLTFITSDSDITSSKSQATLEPIILLLLFYRTALSGYVTFVT